MPTPSLFIFTRSYADEVVLVIHNLSEQDLDTMLDLAEYEGKRPVDILGSPAEFPIIGSGPYTVTIPPFSSLWLRLT
jgi:maltose alpha-D-glucosyltransferase/alpha-amylase